MLCFNFILCYFVFIAGNHVLVVESALSIKVNSIADKILPSVQKLAKKIGFDPLAAPPITDDLSVAIVNLTDGAITEASKFMRNEDFTIGLAPSILPTLRINASLYFPNLRAKFNYSLEAFVYSDTGFLNATISNITGHITLDMRLLGIKFANPKFKIDHFGDVDVTMTSDSYINWLQNIIADNAIPFFKSHITGIAEDTINQLLEKNIKILNKNKFKYAFQAVKDRLAKFFKLKK